MHVSVAEMKAQLAEVLRKAAAGEEIHVTRHGKPYLVLKASLPEGRRLPRVGAFEGDFEVPDPEEWDKIPTGFEP